MSPTCASRSCSGAVQRACRSARRSPAVAARRRRDRAAADAASGAARVRPSRLRFDRARRRRVQSGRSARLVSSSRLRRVAASSSTASLRSSVRRPRRCGNAAFCVSRTYCKQAARRARSPVTRSAQPKPARSRVCELLAQRARRRSRRSKCHGGRSRTNVVTSAGGCDCSGTSSSAGRRRSISLGERFLARGFQHAEAAARQLEPREAEALAFAIQRGEQRVAALFEERLVGDRARRHDAHDLRARPGPSTSPDRRSARRSRPIRRGARARAR